MQTPDADQANTPHTGAGTAGPDAPPTTIEFDDHSMLVHVGSR